MGRPRKEIDAESFEKLCMMHCTLIEIADFFDVSEDTIERWCKRNYRKSFAEVIKKKSGKGKISLRRLQWQAAENGNITMQIWLGKQWLGQAEKVETKNETVEENVVKLYLPDDGREERNGDN